MTSAALEFALDPVGRITAALPLFGSAMAGMRPGLAFNVAGRVCQL